MSNTCRCEECGQPRMDEMTRYCIKCYTEGCSCELDSNWPEAKCT